MIDAPTACNPRDAISHGTDGLNPASADATIKITKPAWYTRRLPSRSAIRPIERCRLETAMKYAITTHCTVHSSTAKAAASDGSDTNTMLAVSVERETPIPVTIVATNSRRPDRFTVAGRSLAFVIDRQIQFRKRKPPAFGPRATRKV